MNDIKYKSFINYLIEEKKIIKKFIQKLIYWKYFIFIINKMFILMSMILRVKFFIFLNIYLSFQFIILKMFIFKNS